MNSAVFIICTLCLLFFICFLYHIKITSSYIIIYDFS